MDPRQSNFASALSDQPNSISVHSQLQPVSQTQTSPVPTSPVQPLEVAQVPELPKPTFGQKLADRMASKVGSWGFLIGQTTVLTAWVGCNLTPGMPHWDDSPFILLNLVFSFASAYTAPVVLMSQNRQSDEDRAHAMQNHQVNLQTAQNLELLHQKMDAMYSQKLAELTELIQQQTRSVAPIKPQSPAYVGFLPHNIAQAQQSTVLPMVDTVLFTQTSLEQSSEDASPRN